MEEGQDCHNSQTWIGPIIPKELQTHFPPVLPAPTPYATYRHQAYSRSSWLRPGRSCAGKLLNLPQHIVDRSSFHRHSCLRHCPAPHHDRETFLGEDPTDSGLAPLESRTSILGGLVCLPYLRNLPFKRYSPKTACTGVHFG